MPWQVSQDEKTWMVVTRDEAASGMYKFTRFFHPLSVDEQAAMTDATIGVKGLLPDHDIIRTDEVAKASIDKAPHSHYHKYLPTVHLDIYRVLVAFGVTDPCIAHAVKKLLVPGQRGSKTVDQDIKEAISSLTRWQEMRVEEERAPGAVK